MKIFSMVCVSLSLSLSLLQIPGDTAAASVRSSQREMVDSMTKDGGGAGKPLCLSSYSSTEQSEFLRDLIILLLNDNPADRPTAEEVFQVAEAQLEKLRQPYYVHKSLNRF